MSLARQPLLDDQELMEQGIRATYPGRRRGTTASRRLTSDLNIQGTVTGRLSRNVSEQPPEQQLNGWHGGRFHVNCIECGAHETFQVGAGQGRWQGRLMGGFRCPDCRID